MTHYQTPPPRQPFFKSGGGIALIVTGGLVLVMVLCVFGCFGMTLIGAATPHPSLTP